MKEDITGKVIELFAINCEKLNDYASSLRVKWNHADIKTGADIRYYLNGWKLEKYIEIYLNDDERVPVWWLELGMNNGQWIIVSSVSISNTDVCIEFPEEHSSDINTLQISLNRVLEQLVTIADKENDFSKIVEEMQRGKLG